MKTLQTIILIVVVAIVVSASAFAIYVAKNKQRIIDNVTFRFNIAGINFSSLLNPIINIKTTITNKNNFFIIFSKLYVELFYNGDLIAQSNGVDNKTHFIPINGTTSFDTEMKLNANILKIKQPIKIDYKIDVYLFGFKIDTITDSFTI